jgi:DNA-binding beta-propeller fold protein YncE
MRHVIGTFIALADAFERRDVPAALRSTMLQSSAIILIAALLAIPFSGARARDTGLMFAGFDVINHIAVIDPWTNATVKTLTDCRGPRDMHFNPDHSRLYVACRDDDDIHIIDVANLEVVGRLHTPSRPETFGVDEKRRRVYVANHEGASLAVVDMDHDIIVREIATGAGPGSVFVGDDDRFVYVASVVGDFVHRIDADSGHVVDNVATGTRPHRFAATPDGRNLMVAAELSGEIHIIDTGDFTVAATMGFSCPDAAQVTAQVTTHVTVADFLLTRDGRTAYVVLGGAAHLVAAVDVPARRIKDYIPVGERSANISMTRDEEILFVTNVSGADITSIDIKSHKVTASTPVSRHPSVFVIDN